MFGLQLLLLAGRFAEVNCLWRWERTFLLQLSGECRVSIEGRELYKWLLFFSLLFLILWQVTAKVWVAIEGCKVRTNGLQDRARNLRGSRSVRWFWRKTSPLTKFKAVAQLVRTLARLATAFLLGSFC